MVPFMRLALAAATVWGVNSIQVGDKVSVGIALAELCVLWRAGSLSPVVRRHKKYEFGSAPCTSTVWHDVSGIHLPYNALNTFLLPRGEDRSFMRYKRGKKLEKDRWPPPRVAW